MAEREDFVAWLEKLDPPIPTTHDVEVAWRAWQARADEIGRLREALRKQAVVSRHRMASGGGSIPVGFSCEICEADCDMGQPLIHVGDCPLTVLNPSQ